jgi:hypothetical protein
MQAEKDAEFVGAALDAGLRAARFSLPPSSEEFAASIEPKNVPAVTPLRLIFSKLLPSSPSFCSHRFFMCSRVSALGETPIFRYSAVC